MSLRRAIMSLHNRFPEQASMPAVVEILKELYLRQGRLERQLRDLASKQDTQAIELDPGASASKSTRKRAKDLGNGSCPHFGDARSSPSCKAHGGYCPYVRGIDCGMCHTRIQYKGNT